MMAIKILMTVELIVKLIIIISAQVEMNLIQIHVQCEGLGLNQMMKRMNAKLFEEMD